MKHSLRNDTGINSSKPVNDPGEGNNNGIPVSGPRTAPEERLLDGKLVSFKNAENNDAPLLKSYNLEEGR